MGTSHPSQLTPRLPPEGSALVFRDVLMDLCRRYVIAAIAEEMSVEAQKGQLSISHVVADALQIPHRLCDPDSKERAEAGIVDEGLLAFHAAQRKQSAKQLKRAIGRERAKRERIWLRNVQEIERSPLLFVCGADHVRHFARLLRANGFIVRILAEDI